jgi:hypothetical protein
MHQTHRHPLLVYSVSAVPTEDAAHAQKTVIKHSSPSALGVMILSFLFPLRAPPPIRVSPWLPPRPLHALPPRATPARMERPEWSRPEAAVDGTCSCCVVSCWPRDDDDDDVDDDDDDDDDNGSPSPAGGPPSPTQDPESRSALSRGPRLMTQTTPPNGQPSRKRHRPNQGDQTAPSPPLAPETSARPLPPLSQTQKEKKEKHARPLPCAAAYRLPVAPRSGPACTRP